MSGKTRAATAPRGRPRGLAPVALLGAVAVALIAAGVTSSVTTASPGGSGATGSAGSVAPGSSPDSARAAAATALTGSVVLTDQAWTCRSAVDLDLVKVTLRNRSENAIYLRPGCTGRIDRIEVDTWHLDGVKVGNASDVVIGGGYIACHDRDEGSHQDGVQAQSGLRITFRSLTIDCPLANNAAFFVSAFSGTPTDVVCDGCMLKPANSTVNIKDSVRSGVRNSTVCTGRAGAIRIQEGAVNPVNSGNSVLSRRDGRCVSTA